ncbi:flagellar FlbD family protein [Acidobacterium sp. S8]|uniref:flagellar FlbD family protein n=1 Tax=Acidobacterium sp. S8 TaxID=1641854 RepID=UPI00131BEFF2|nr:flagellar FlbD family protein [Acidobacterium sp. S8]
MIELTRLNGQRMVVNSDLIKYVESSPDTTLTLIHGEKIVVLEPCEEVVRRVSSYRAALLVHVMRQAADSSLTELGSIASGASALRAFVAEQAELPDGSAEALQLRRRRSES